MDFKKCTTCKTDKPLHDFYRSKNTKTGYTYGCKTCYQKIPRKKTIKARKTLAQRAEDYYIYSLYMKTKCKTKLARETGRDRATILAIVKRMNKQKINMDKLTVFSRLYEQAIKYLGEV